MNATLLTSPDSLPAWLPDAARLYLSYTLQGQSLRALARREGCHASTILRQVRRFENRREDPLIDEALSRLEPGDTGDVSPTTALHDEKESTHMSAPLRPKNLVPDEKTILSEALRVLRRLAEPGSVLVIAPDMEKAAIMRNLPDGRTLRVAVLARPVAQAFALKDWISCRHTGRVSMYDITTAGRAMLKRMLTDQRDGFAESPSPFGDQHRIWGAREISEGPDAERRRLRCNLAESPIALLARRKDKDGTPFLSAEMVAAAERLREDFELAQMGPRVAQNWDRFLTAGDRGSFSSDNGIAEGPRAARDRVAAALRDLVPGLGDMVLRCCCFLEGMEQAEQRMGWSARSGKIVLRIALMRLRRHYEETGNTSARLIG